VALAAWTQDLLLSLRTGELTSTDHAPDAVSGRPIKTAARSRFPSLKHAPNIAYFFLPLIFFSASAVASSSILSMRRAWASGVL